MSEETLNPSTTEVPAQDAPAGEAVPASTPETPANQEESQPAAE